jgi:hypothetical protein
MEKIKIIFAAIFIIALGITANAQVNSAFSVTWEYPSTTGNFYILSWEGTDSSQCMFLENADYKGDTTLGQVNLKDFIVATIPATQREYVFSSLNNGNTLAVAMVYEDTQGYYSPLAVSSFIKKGVVPNKPTNIILIKK